MVRSFFPGHGRTPPTLTDTHGSDRCGRQSPLSTTTFSVLTLPLADATLDGCFHAFCASERIEGVDCARCCARGVARPPAHKRLLFSRFPRTLLVRMQRNAFDPARGVVFKDDARVHMRSELDLSDLALANALAMEESILLETFDLLDGRIPSTLDPPAFMQTPSKRSPGSAARHNVLASPHSPSGTAAAATARYHLVAIVEHVGASAQGGHFVTYRRLGAQHAWAKASDESVAPCALDALSTACAFLYVFEAAGAWAEL